MIHKKIGSMCLALLLAIIGLALVGCDAPFFAAGKQNSDKPGQANLTTENLSAHKITVDNGMYFYEGDLVISEDQARQLVSGVGARGILIKGSHLWTPAETVNLKYSFSATFGGSIERNDLVRRAVREAAQMWSNACGVNFVETSDIDYQIDVKQVADTDNGAAWADPWPYPAPMVFGITYNTARTYNFNDLRSIALHEFGHLIGLDHEQARPDATTGSQWADYRKGTGQLIGSFDPVSIMHYDHCYSNRLSAGDISTAQYLYGASKPTTTTTTIPFVPTTSNTGPWGTFYSGLSGYSGIYQNNSGGGTYLYYNMLDNKRIRVTGRMELVGTHWHSGPMFSTPDGRWQSVGSSAQASFDFTFQAGSGSRCSLYAGGPGGGNDTSYVIIRDLKFSTLP